MLAGAIRRCSEAVLRKDKRETSASVFKWFSRQPTASSARGGVNALVVAVLDHQAQTVAWRPRFAVHTGHAAVLTSP